MSIYRVRPIPLGMLVLSTVLASGQTAPVKTGVQGAAAPSAINSAAPQPGPALFRPKAAEMAVKPPKVVCSGDQLTISASNSTLESILVQVSGCTGAHIEIPDGAARVHSFEELGPGPIRQVLDSLLSGTEYNYVIESSEANPRKVDTVLLSARKTDAAPTGNAPPDVALSPARRAWMQARQQNGRQDPAAAEEESLPEADAPVAENSTTTGAANADAAKSADAAKNPASAVADGTPAPADATPVPAVSPADVANADPNKVQDRINSMQQLFDQRRQMIEKQSAPSSGSSTASPN